MSDSDNDIVVHDASGRRRFIRTGAALAVGGAALLAGRAALAADCDRSASGCGCSDSDSGEGSDPTGKGKRCSDLVISTREIEVTKLRG